MDIYNRIARIEKRANSLRVELSYTLLDWILMDNIINEKAEEFKLDLTS